MARRFAGRALILLVGLLVGLGVLELGLRVSGAASKLYHRALHINTGYLEVLELSDDPFLRYEARPGASHHYASIREDWRRACGLEEGDPVPHTVHINAVGARGPEVEVTKAPGVVRVLAVGGSTTFGTAVDEQDGWAGQLQTVLNARYRGSTTDASAYEVVNFGLPGYSTGQAARLALRKLELLDPDLVVMQIFNGCMRHFLPQDPRAHDPALADELSLLEAFPPDGQATEPVARAHFWLLRHSATYLSLRALLRQWWHVGVPTGPSSHCDHVDVQEMERLHDALGRRGARLVYFDIRSGNRPAPRPNERSPVEGPFPGTTVSFMEPGRECEYYFMHPPARVLAEWAEGLAAALGRHKLLTARPAAVSPKAPRP